MTFADYQAQITTDCRLLSPAERLAVCLISCNRLSPLYAEFARREQWGDEAPFAQCRIEAIEYFRGERELPSVSVDTLNGLIPHTEGFGLLSGSFAVNAGIAHVSLIQQFSATDATPAIDALQMCYETIDFCVQNELDPGCERSVPLREIDAHAMMVAEIELQVSVLLRVRGHSDLPRFAAREIDDTRLAKFMLEAVTTERNGG